MVGYSKTTATDRTLPIEEARAEGYAWFDRWLADHDKRLRKEALREAKAAIEAIDVVVGGDDARRYESALEWAADAVLDIAEAR